MQNSYLKPCLSPDGQTLFFNVQISTGSGSSVSSIYSCNIDGSNLKSVLVSSGKSKYVGIAY